MAIPKGKYSEEEIKRYKQRFAFENALKRQQSKNSGGGGGFDPTAWIDDLSGMGGALGGAAAGTAIMPGLGTLIGGVAGGFLGGGAGSVAEQKIRDGEVDWGKVGGKATSEGLMGAIPGVFKAGKALRHAPRGAKMAALMGKTDDVAKLSNTLQMAADNAGGNIYTGTGKLRTAARNIDLKQSGLRIGQNLGGGKVLTPDYADDLYAMLRHGSKQYIKGGIPAGSPMKQARAAQNLFNEVGVKLTAKLDEVNRVLTAGEKKWLNTEVKKRVANAIGVGKTTSITDDVTRLLRKTKDIKGLELLRQELDDVAYKASGAGKTAAAKQARLAREAIDSFVTHGSGIDDGYKALKGDWSKANDILKMVSQGKGVPGGTNIPLTLGTRVPNTGIQSKAASKIANAGFSFADDTPMKFAESLTKGGATKGAVGAYLGNKALGFGGGAGAGQQDQIQMIEQAAKEAGLDPQMLLETMMSMQQDPMAQQMGGFSQSPNMAQQMGGFNQQQAPQQMIPREVMIEAMMADLASTGGKNMDKLQKFYEFANATDGASGGDSAMNAKMQTAQTIVDNLMGVYEQVGGARGLYGGTATDWAGRLNIGEGNERARAYEQNRMSYLTPIIKAFGEVGVLTDKDREVVATAIPSITDTQAQAEQKINLLYQMLATLGQGGSISSIADEQLSMQQDLGGFAQ
jgi:hypothetical protein